MNTVITVQGLQKAYKLYTKPSERLKEALIPFGRKRHQNFYALRDINFSLLSGQSLGIIGKNGSGKSTLLKILAGVLSPSAGQVSVLGRVGSLLELGGGFNPELSGRENAEIQLLFNGEVENGVDAIERVIAFAELGSFINQPVKKYSSGMFMRLAFACATVISPEVLIVDEALAVGDAYFVKKCMDRMQALLAQGTTMLFVSHDLEAVRRLCDCALFLNNGEQMGFGPTPEIAEQYVAFLREMEAGGCPATLREKEGADETACESLFEVQGAIDLAEQRLFVSGYWPWYTDIASGLSARYSPQAGGKIAFKTKGNRVALSFLRGGGFALPKVFINHRPCSFAIENDIPFLATQLAPMQVRNFTHTLPLGEHTISIVAENSKIAWLGGESSFEDLPLLYNPIKGWEAGLTRRATIYGDRKAVITNVELLDFSGNPVSGVSSGDTVRLRLHAARLGEVRNISIGYKIHDRLSVGMFGTTTLEEQYALNGTALNWVVEFIFTVPLKGDTYTIACAIASVDGSTNIIHHYIDVAMVMHVEHYSRRTIWGEFYNPVHVCVREQYK
ncbi:MAG: Vitamin B12 import ATP-binding protein BtuD [Desulfovibrio sp.]